MQNDNDEENNNAHCDHGQDDNDYIHNQRRCDGVLRDCFNLCNLLNDSMFKHNTWEGWGGGGGGGFTYAVKTADAQFPAT
jgi:hypothetical protein